MKTFIKCLLARGEKRQFKWIDNDEIKKDFKVQIQPEGQYWIIEDTYDKITEQEYLNRKETNEL